MAYRHYSYRGSELCYAEYHLEKACLSASKDGCCFAKGKTSQVEWRSAEDGHVPETTTQERERERERERELSARKEVICMNFYYLHFYYQL